MIQAKLTIGQPRDKYEREADRVAEQVMQAPEPTIQRQIEEEAEEEVIQSRLLSSRNGGVLQRQMEPEEEEEEGPIQTQASAKTPTLVPPDLSRTIHALRGGGQPLSKDAQRFFVPRFGHDFSQVRIHADKRAAQAARSINSMAFTTGTDIVFAAGHYDFASKKGRRLLAHELTHVVQQNNGQVPDKIQRKPRLTAKDLSRIVVFDEAKKRQRVISIDGKDFGRNYIDRNIVSAQYWSVPTSFASQNKKYKKFRVFYRDKRWLEFGLDDIPLRYEKKTMPGKRPPVLFKPRRYLQKGGFIYPIVYSDATVPRLIDVATTIAYNQRRRQKYLEVATLTFKFAVILSSYAPSPRAPGAMRGGGYKRPKVPTRRASKKPVEPKKESMQETLERETREAHPEWFKRPRSTKPLPKKTRTEKPLKSLGYDKRRPRRGHYTRKRPRLQSLQQQLDSLSKAERHHFWPKYLGGIEKQTLKGLPRYLHKTLHAAMYRWKGGIFDPKYHLIDKASLKKIMTELREFYQKAEGGFFKSYMPDLERAIKETLVALGKGE